LSLSLHSGEIETSARRRSAANPVVAPGCHEELVALLDGDEHLTGGVAVVDDVFGRVRSREPGPVAVAAVGGVGSAVTLTVGPVVTVANCVGTGTAFVTVTCVAMLEALVAVPSEPTKAPSPKAMIAVAG
jgi:hypothetical protein